MTSRPLWAVIITPPAQRDLRKIPERERERIHNAITRTVADWPGSDIRKLKGREDTWRGRVGGWRIFFLLRPDERKVYVLNVRHRREAYR